MLQINIHHIPENGLEIDTTIPSAELEINTGDRIKKITPLVCELKASMVEKDLVVRGNTTLVANVACDKCLVEYEEIIESEDICIVKENTPEIVDLTNDIREDILLAFPQLFLCSDDCKGLCYKCGINLNLEKCKCDFESETSSPWDALNNINFDSDK